MKANNHMIPFEKKQAVFSRKKSFKWNFYLPFISTNQSLMLTTIPEQPTLLPEQINIKHKRQDQLFEISELYLTW